MAVLLTTFGLTVFTDLTIAVGVGMVLASMLFMKRMSEVTNVGAIRYLFIKLRRAPLWELAFPILGICVVIYTLYKNVHGVAFPYSRFPLVVAIWLAGGSGHW